MLLNNLSISSSKDLIPCSSCMGRDDFLEIYDNEDSFSITTGNSSIVIEKSPTCYPIKEVSAIRKFTDEEGLYINPTREVKTTRDSFGKICLADYDKKKEIINKLISITNKEIDDVYRKLHKNIIQNKNTIDVNTLEKFTSVSHGAGLTKNSYHELMNANSIMIKRKLNTLSNETLGQVSEYFLIGKVVAKTHLYKSRNKKTKMYLIKGDRP